MTARSRLLAPRELDVAFDLADVLPGHGFRVKWHVPTTPVALGVTPHCGLLYQRYFPAHDDPEKSSTGHPLVSPGGFDVRSVGQAAASQGASARKVKQEVVDPWQGAGALAWYAEVVGAIGVDAEMLGELWRRRGHVISRQPDSVAFTVLGTGRAAVGTGNPSRKENAGVALHHTYGFPVLPGSSLKGLTRHYVVEELGANAIQGLSGGPLASYSADELTTLVFGSDEGDARAGIVAFHDGWPLTANDWFEIDVVTSHHHKYYGQPASGSLEADDTSDPMPVAFLVLKTGIEFRLGLSSTSAAGPLGEGVARACVRVAARWLIEALARWGAGAKTASGYGRFSAGSSLAGTLKDRIGDDRAALDGALDAPKHKLRTALAVLPPSEREIAADALRRAWRNRLPAERLAALEAWLNVGDSVVG